MTFKAWIIKKLCIFKSAEIDFPGFPDVKIKYVVTFQARIFLFYRKYVGLFLSNHHHCSKLPNWIFSVFWPFFENFGHPRHNYDASGVANDNCSLSNVIRSITNHKSFSFAVCPAGDLYFTMFCGAVIVKRFSSDSLMRLLSCSSSSCLIGNAARVVKIHGLESVRFCHCSIYRN